MDADTLERIPPIITTSGSQEKPLKFPSNLMPGQYVVAITGAEIPPIIETSTSSREPVRPRKTALKITVTDTTTKEPLIEGTDIPVYRVSALLDGGMTISQIREDFPSLTADQILWARDYARTIPNVGKQYPKKSLKRLLRSSGLYELDKEFKV